MVLIHYVSATGFYSGYSPIAPGIVGSVIILVIYWFLSPLLMTLHQFFVCVLFFLGVWASNQIYHEIDKDSPIIVIDEMVGMLIPLLLCPHTMKTFFTVFILFRLFDIIKPFPVKQAEKMPAGGELCSMM